MPNKKSAATTVTNSNAAGGSQGASRKGTSIGVYVIAAVVILAVAVFGGSFVVNAAKPSVKPNLVSATPQSSEAPSAGGEREDSSKSTGREKDNSTSESGSRTENGTTSPPPVKTPAAAIDLSNADDYYNINIFLSNFAEWRAFYENGKSYDRDHYDMEQLVNWGMWHNAINNEGTLSNDSVDLGNAPVSAISREVDKTPASRWPRHMETQLIHDSIQRYMGLDLYLSGYNSGNGAYYEQNGVMYEGLYRGSADPIDNIALANYVSAVDADTVRVDFTIYFGNRGYEVADKSWYGLNPGELESALRASGAKNIATKTGTAVVDVSSSGNDKAFTLASFSVR